MTKLSNYERASVVEAYECGDKIADIAAKFGIAETHVSSIVKAAGAPKRIGSGIPQTYVPTGYRRLASGKIIRYTPPP